VVIVGVNLDSSGVVGIVGILASVAALMVTRRHDLRVLEKRVTTERQSARVQFERDVVREHHRLKLEAYSAFLGAEARFFFAAQRGNSESELGPVMAEATEGLVRVRLVSSPQLQDTVTAFWTTTLDVLSTREQSRHLPTQAAADALMEPKIEARSGAMRVLEKAMMIELEEILRESMANGKAELTSHTVRKRGSANDITSITG
jgi:hypothetical protein